MSDHILGGFPSSDIDAFCLPIKQVRWSFRTRVQRISFDLCLSDCFSYNIILEVLNYFICPLECISVLAISFDFLYYDQAGLFANDALSPF